MNQHRLLDPAPSLARLCDLRRRYLSEQSELLVELEDAHGDLDRWTRTRQQLLAEGVTAPAVERLCQSLLAHTTCLEKDLVESRSALAGLDEEIDELTQPDWTWVPSAVALRRSEGLVAPSPLER